MNARGFTIIEIMVVLVIIAVLTMIAVPLYKADQTTANRTYAKFQLINIKDQLLAADLATTAGIATAATQANILSKNQAPQYVISVDRTVDRLGSDMGITNFTVIATPLLANKKDGVLCIDSKGLTAWAGENGARCLLRDYLSTTSDVVKLWGRTWDE